MVVGWVSFVRWWLWYWWHWFWCWAGDSCFRWGVRVDSSGTKIGRWGGSGVPLGSGLHPGRWRAAPLIRMRWSLVGLVDTVFAAV